MGVNLPAELLSGHAHLSDVAVRHMVHCERIQEGKPELVW